MKDFVTIAIFQYATEYAVLENLFEQEEIRYFFMDQTMMSIFPLSSSSIGGIRLQVHKDDVERAQEIIESLNNSSSPLEIV